MVYFYSWQKPFLVQLENFRPLLFYDSFSMLLKYWNILLECFCLQRLIIYVLKVQQLLRLGLVNVRFDQFISVRS